ncbi:hypothetical protein [Modestobacter altitudinis]|uniref:hypothetical protein n=1 Tax=Modestobacter altitudinis TaxID=2213158 RepID=UPI00110CEACC|nr:hypothetical protein [Modestobacter altitudinis]
MYEKLPAIEPERIVSMGEGFILAPLTDDAVVEPADEPSDEYPLPVDERNWANKVVLRSSSLLHRVGANFVSRASIDAAQAVAERATAGKYSSDQVDPIVVGQGDASFPEELLRESLAAGVGIVTVAEVAVPIHVLGRVPDSLSVNFSELSRSANLDALPGGYDWPPYVSQADFANEDDYAAEVALRAMNGLRIAIADVRDLQTAYHAVTRTPLTLISYELLPPILPVGFRQLKGIGDPAAGSVLSVQTHENLWSWLAPPDLSPEQYEQYSNVRSRLDRMAFTSHLDLRREADVARRRDGDTRAAAIYSGLAAEALLDEVLLHLMWEEALTPEQAAGVWRDGLLSRVKKDYAPRLGGDWDITSQGAVGRWSRDCAELRHRAVHGGYEASYAEVDASMAALDGLLAYVCDRLCLPAKLRHYPRTALALAGPPGLKRRSQYSRRLVNLQADATETNWDEAFSRWREAYRRIRRQAQGFPRLPVVHESELIAVARPDGAKYFCLSHRETVLAVKVDVGPDVCSKNARVRVVADWLTDIDVTGFAEGGLSMGVSGTDLTGISIRGDWVEAYHLLPLASLMVDKSDLR